MALLWWDDIPIQVMPHISISTTKFNASSKIEKRKLEANTTDIAILTLLEKHNNKSEFELIMKDWWRWLKLLGQTGKEMNGAEMIMMNKFIFYLTFVYYFKIEIT